MASFSPKKYFKKIVAHTLLSDLYKSQNIDALFPISQETSKKTAFDMFNESYDNLSPADKLTMRDEFARIDTITTKHTGYIRRELLKKHSLPTIEKVECTTDADKTLYFYLTHENLRNELAFFHDFYTRRSYMIYEAKKVDLKDAEFKVSELTREIERIAKKKDTGGECDIESNLLGDKLYIRAYFDGEDQVSQERDSVSGEIVQRISKKKLTTLHIVYLREQQEVLISYTGGKEDKLIYLDTFLRIICGEGYQEKIEKYTLTQFKNNSFTFSGTTHAPLISWKVKALTLSFGDDTKYTKKLRLTLPSAPQEVGLSPLHTTLEELKLTQTFAQAKIANITLSFSFTDSTNKEKAVIVPCTISDTRSSLCPLFPYEATARKLLTNANVYNGFIEQAIKEKEDVAKKWEI